MQLDPHILDDSPLFVREPGQFYEELDACSNLHTHWRNGPMASWMVDMLIGNGFRGVVLGMPNTKPDPLLEGDDAIAYFQRDIEPALLRHPVEKRFTPILTIQITEQTTPAMIQRACELGIRAAKVYPRWVTTHSENGVLDYEKIFPALMEAERRKMIVCFHAEDPSFNVPGRKKESNFILILKMVRRECPKLKIVVEHISSHEMVKWVWKEDTEYVAATIAVQYLAFTSDDVLGYSESSKGLIQVHNGCKPQYKDPEDREAVQEAALSGDPRFFYGGDDAAHFESAKHDGACGTFSTPVAIPWLISWFKQRGAYPKLNSFLAHYGPDYYGFARPQGKLIFQKKTWKVPPKYPVPGTNQSVVSLFAGEEMGYQLMN
jgi:dihydroorotase